MTFSIISIPFKPTVSRDLLNMDTEYVNGARTRVVVLSIEVQSGDLIELYALINVAIVANLKYGNDTVDAQRIPFSFIVQPDAHYRVVTVSGTPNIAYSTETDI